MVTERFVLIDTDAGTDDAMAILMCLQAHKSPKHPMTVLGITCLSGNTKVDNVTRNVTRLLEVTGLKEIPVFRGCEVPVVFPYENVETTPYHGHDGFGDVFDDVVEPKLESENAVSAIIRLAHEYKGKLSILALGPHTNLAMAIRLDPTISDCVCEIYAMGGNIEGVGNVTVSGEFNFFFDPEAAYITLSSYACPVYIVPWEVCLRQATRPLEWRRDVLAKVGTPGAELMNKIEHKVLSSSKWTQKYNGWTPCDQVVAAALIDHRVIKNSVEYHCTVEVAGRHTRGLMIVDTEDVLNQSKKTTIVSEIDQELFEKVMLWGVGGIEYEML